MAEITSPFRSIPELFQHRGGQAPNAEAFRFRSGEVPGLDSRPAEAGWRSLTWGDAHAHVSEIAVGLHSLGVEPEQRCAVLSGTRVEWILADLAVLCAGGATTTIYPSSPPDECSHVLEDSGAVLVFAEDDEQIDKLREANPSHVNHVITFDGTADGRWVLGLDDLRSRGRELVAARPELFDRLVAGVRQDQLASLIYTSGTTGPPKGVRLTHANWLYVGEAIRSAGAHMLRETDLQYLWLPLAHAFGKVLEVAQIRVGFPTAIDGDVNRITENLPVVRPTFMGAAPRIFEKIYGMVLTEASGGTRLKWAIFRWARDVGLGVSRQRQRGIAPGPATRLRMAVADRLVFRKLRNRFGGRLRYFVSGSAPLSPEIAEFFDAAGVAILEGYGLTETGAATFVNRPEDYRIGTVGPPLPDTEVDFGEDGEVLLRNPALMSGYHGLPEETAETLDERGWLHTGDIGELRDGFLSITDRKKDLIKTSGGKYVPPQRVENHFKTLCPYVGNILVHGNRRPYCTALITLDEEAVRAWAQNNGLGGLSCAELAAHDKVRAATESYVDQLNSGLAPHETIKSFRLLHRDFGIERGELTPSLKLKRRRIEQEHSALLDEMYA